MEHKASFYEKYIKRALDILLSALALVVLSPVLLVTAILVRTKLGSPVIFHQDRPGKDEKIFRLYKFRSMTDERDEKGDLLPDEGRLTKFGKLLRSTSLDELPEIELGGSVSAPISEGVIRNRENLNNLRIARASFEETPVEDALEFLRAEARQSGQQMNFIFESAV